MENFLPLYFARFDEKSDIWNFVPHAHDCFEALYFLYGNARISTPRLPTWWSIRRAFCTRSTCSLTTIRRSTVCSSAPRIWPCGKCCTVTTPAGRFACCWTA